MKKLMTVNVHPYPVEVWFAADKDTHMQKRKEIANEPLKTTGDFDGLTSVSDDGSQIVFGCFEGGSSTLVHEISHVVISILTYIGMPINNDTTEAFAYLYQSIYEQANEFLNQRVNYNEIRECLEVPRRGGPTCCG